MNRHTVITTFVATFGAAIALASTTAVAGKPSGGTSDPCTTAVDFPTLAYAAKANNKWTIYVADSLGKCSRAIATTSATPVPKFSYPVDASTDKGRVVWRSNSTTISSVDFTVLPGNTVSVMGTNTLTTSAGCCSLDISRDGGTVYFSPTDTSLGAINIAGLAVSEIYSMPVDDSSWFYEFASVNGDQTKIFATKAGKGVNGGAYPKLVRIDFKTDTTAAQEVVLRSPLATSGGIFTPAASKDVDPGTGKSVDRVAFVEYVAETNNCTPLVVTDSNGIQVFPAPTAPAHYGIFPTWVGDKVVMERRGPMDGSRKCGSTNSITQISPDDTETVLTSGYKPDGR